ncbi:MAG: hypothetical protein A2233_05120 [Candidatus Kerfeldbacteria bacterium RIFOXYA2_FULL_38_24]|uniref:Glycosyl transferase family 1 domain-containing protein n=1 Tax=Candidatus Kerfeldbacteria bacterium RIFOXYB2_FULL_38_14 TaxID=1798547 RepID=A0A1G2BGE8_9BACT|nr:MAG: hypothetical protein A2233_05120 [Candidatus Kerfeldbacteria bacterium RIFOXYA2_FULL_38_24]OGY88212.1 MAG: hypothetical protein A2319_03415 [Candidatus Kerfeldbacteria bacterium RIFOXYB2_FULL_38_14]
MKIAFLTRKYPPQKGGMETFSWELTKNYPNEKIVLHHGKRQIDVLWSAPLLILQTWFLKKETALFHLGDLVLGLIAPLLKLLTKKPIVVTVHALELTYNAFWGLYQKLLNFTLKTQAIDHYVAVSEYTKKLLLTKGILANKITVIPHGVSAPKNTDLELARKKLCEKIACSPDRLLLLSVARLVRRKGLAWFIEEVLPKLQKYNPLYLVAGSGLEQKNIEKIIQKTKQQNNVCLLGKVNSEILENLYQGADIFIAPNIPVANDSEGFGFTALEAAVHGLPVIAADLEGIPSAIHQGKNGILLEPQNAEAFVKQITVWIEQNPVDRKNFGKQAQIYTLKNFRWPDVALNYQKLFESLV